MNDQADPAPRPTPAGKGDAGSDQPGQPRDYGRRELMLGAAAAGVGAAAGLAAAPAEAQASGQPSGSVEQAQKNRNFPITPGLTDKPVGTLRGSVGKRFLLQGSDQTGAIVEWIVRPTGPHSFELTVPATHELGTPSAWENISIMAQRVVARGTASDCGCDGNQCGCQGSNCGTNCNANRGEFRLLATDAEVTTLAGLGNIVPPSQ